MNDKEKLISFINKGKENKPVKEVHVIKDSPTEAHILLVNEDGTNVASNRFEIMDAQDLMTLIENPPNSGLNISISEDNNKKVWFSTTRTLYKFNKATYPSTDTNSVAKQFSDFINSLGTVIYCYNDEIDIFEVIENPYPGARGTYYRISLKDFIDYGNVLHIRINNDDFISHIGYFNGAFRILFYNGSPEKTFSLSSTDIENLETQHDEIYYIYFKENDALAY